MLPNDISDDAKPHGKKLHLTEQQVTTTISVTPAINHTEASRQSTSSESFVEIEPDDLLHSYYAVELQTIQTSTHFTVLHALMYDTIQAWAIDKSANTHPFYILWKKAVFKGMDR